LKKGRGRVRRISVLDPEGYQVNILASSTLSAERLIGDHAWPMVPGERVQAWQRAVGHQPPRCAEEVVPVDPDDVMPNPARRRLDIARRAASVREGDARNKLARLEDKRVDTEDPRFVKVLATIAESIAEEQEIDALRPSVPTHARVADTELAGRLVKHDGQRKLLARHDPNCLCRTRKAISLRCSPAQ
jgi:hypothetical protein